MKKFTVAALGIVGLSTALLSLPQSAKAADINAGTNYAQTDPGNTYLVLNNQSVTIDNTVYNVGTATLPLGGVPINNVSSDPNYSGKADTVINRYQDINFVNGTGSTNIQITKLSLAHENPDGSLASIALGGTSYDVFAGLQSYAQDPSINQPSSPILSGVLSSNGTLYGTTSSPYSDGVLTAYKATTTNSLEPTGYTLPAGAAGTWNSGFTIYGVAVLVPTNKVPSTIPSNYVQNIVQESYNVATPVYPSFTFEKNFTNSFNGAWFTTPQGTTENPQITGPNLVNSEPTNFYISSNIKHDVGDGTVHTVTGLADLFVPEPLTILGAGTALGLGMLLKKQLKRKSK